MILKNFGGVNETLFLPHYFQQFLLGGVHVCKAGWILFFHAMTPSLVCSCGPTCISREVVYAGDRHHVEIT